MSTWVLDGPLNVRHLPFLYQEPPAEIDASYRLSVRVKIAET